MTPQSFLWRLAGLWSSSPLPQQRRWEGISPLVSVCERRLGKLIPIWVPCWLQTQWLAGDPAIELLKNNKSELDQTAN